MSDLISRQDTIDRINEYIEEYSEIDSDGNHSEKWCAMQEAKMTIENMPSAQPEHEQNTPPEQGKSDKFGVKMGETCTDTISRKAAIDEADEWMDAYSADMFEDVRLGIQQVKRSLRKLPSAQPEPKWIPCSERLPDHPENDDYYLVTIQCEHYEGWDDYVTGFAEWTKHGWDELSCYIGQIKVIAWMPLPEPYAERREE